MKQKAALFITFLVAVLVFASLWPQRQIVAWVLLAVFGPLTLVLITSKVNEMSIRHKHYEMPLDQQQITQPKESHSYEYEQ